VSKILFDHIAMAIPRIADAPAVLAGVLGGVPVDGASSAVFNWGVWRFDGGGDLEVLEPRGPDGFVHRFLAARGPGIHHVTFKVPDLDEACERAQARGYPIVGRDDSDPTWMEAFLHPRQALGIVVQLAEERVRRAEGHRRSQPPASTTNPPPPVRILGLRMVARSREAARRQWEEILLGEAEPGGDGSLIYRWPGSPMRLVVEIDATAREGPLAIEYASRREIGLSTDPHPVLGASFLRCPRPGADGA
jgi:methylmalonyl-CoA/ethylmalonyl-CoA epimerase